MKYCFIGLGNMAGAILRGMKASGKFVGDEIYGYDISEEKCKYAQNNYDVKTSESVSEALKQSETVVLAVKPQNLSELFSANTADFADKLILTIAAGKDLAFYQRSLDKKARVIRIMPNINAKVGGAMSALCPNTFVSEDELELAKRIFSTVGQVLEVKEELFQIFAAVSGSSVAFVYMYIDALIKAQLSYNVSLHDARIIACASVMGSAALCANTDEDPLELARQVCSPGGTTIEGVGVLKKYEYEKIVKEAIDAIVAKDELLKNS